MGRWSGVLACLGAAWAFRGSVGVVLPRAVAVGGLGARVGVVGEVKDGGDGVVEVGATDAGCVEVELAGEGLVDELLGVAGAGSIEDEDLLEDGQDEVDVDEEAVVVLLKGIEAGLGICQLGADFGLFGLEVGDGQGLGKAGIEEALLGLGEASDLGLGALGLAAGAVGFSRRTISKSISVATSESAARERRGKLSPAEERRSNRRNMLF